MEQGKPTVPEVMPLVRRLYSGEDVCSRDSGCVGGHLHIVLDDGNIETDHVRWCLAEAQKDACETCAHLAGLMLRMSFTQRHKLYSKVYDR